MIRYVIHPEESTKHCLSSTSTDDDYTHRKVNKHKRGEEKNVEKFIFKCLIVSTWISDLSDDLHLNSDFLLTTAIIFQTISFPLRSTLHPIFLSFLLPSFAYSLHLLIIFMWQWISFVSFFSAMQSRKWGNGKRGIWCWRKCLCRGVWVFSRSIRDAIKAVRRAECTTDEEKTEKKWILWDSQMLISRRDSKRMAMS